MIQSGLGGRIDLYCRFMRSSERPRNSLHLRSLKPERADRHKLSLIYVPSARKLLTNAATGKVGTRYYSSVPFPALSLWSRFWERLNHLACCRCIFFIHEQLIIRAVIPDRCENARGQKRTLQNFHLDLRCILKQHEF